MNIPEAASGDVPAIELPFYDDAWLATQSPVELIELMRRDEDCVPRNVIDECSRRGGVMLNEFAQLLRNEARYWADDTADGDWWLHTHAIRTLGLMTSERAGDMLLAYIEQMDDCVDENLQEWHSGHWPQLFANKPDSVDAQLLAYVQDSARLPFSRLDTLDAALSRAATQGEETLDRMLDAVARLSVDKRESREARLLFGSALLDFPRKRHRALLQKLARGQQQGDMPIFDFHSVTAAFNGPLPMPRWQSMDSVWKFYEPAEIAARQRRRLEDEQAAKASVLNAGPGASALDELFARQDQYAGGLQQPLMRTASKIGRNDLCPCGSGKKYKKCCIGTAA
jgi:SEC-C motif